MLRSSITRICFATILTACARGGTDVAAPIPPAPQPPVSSPPTLMRSVVMSGLSSPWDIAFAPDGAMFFTERCNGLSVRRVNGQVTRIFGVTGAGTLASDLVCLGQSGMHGVALDPQFATNRTVYVFMASARSTPRTNRVVRLVLDAGWTTVTDRTDIVTDIPFKNVANAVGGAGAHSGGRIRFGPDGFLWVTTGDNHNATLPQDPRSLGGKVLRVTRDGAAVGGNNAPAGFDPRIYSYGHRNVQGITWRPGTNNAYVTEHGPNHSDEATQLVAGGNDGWDPQNRPGLTCPDGYCGYAGNATTMPMTDLSRFPNAMRPAWNNNSASQGLGPVTFLRGANWRGWDGRLVVGLMAGQRMVILSLDSQGNATDAVNAPLPDARFRSLVLGLEGDLYVATDSGEIWRVTPSA